MFFGKNKKENEKLQTERFRLNKQSLFKIKQFCNKKITFLKYKYNLILLFLLKFLNFTILIRKKAKHKLIKQEIDIKILFTKCLKLSHFWY